MAEILRVDHIAKSFGGLQALAGVSLSVARGEVLGLIGPNGAGKTTLFNLIMGVHRPDGGRIYFNGKDITGWPTHRIVNAGIARVYQLAQACANKTVYENVELALLSNRIWIWQPSACSAACTLEICQRVGLGDALVQTPGMLPQARLRQLELARAVATEPELLLLDEPFAGLSTAEIRALSAVISDLRASGVTIVLVDHNMRGLMRLVDRVVVISFGRVLVAGLPQEIMQNRLVQEAYLAGGGL
jgi:branched-chain amino acid transport system ATP-binding protein